MTGAGAPAADGYGRARGWYLVGVLTLAYVVAIIDRQILSLLVEPVKRDLAIGDTGVGLLQGFAFGLFYSLVGIPIAWLADRTSRRNIIVAGIALWSLATAACGLARSFAGLFLGRMAVGVGEAALSPAATSMFADVFPRERLAAPISAYTTGAYWGAGLAYLLGGAVVQRVAAHPVAELPLVGTLHSWQLSFLVVAVPGLLLLPLLFTLREPPRRAAAPVAIAGTGMGAFLRTHWRALAPLYGGYSLLVLVTVTVFAWMPALLMRRFGWSAGDTGYVFGLVVLLAGTLGINLGGSMTDRLARRGRTDAPLRVGASILLILAALAALVPNAPSGTQTVFGCALLVFVLAFPAGAGLAAIQAIAPGHMRARMVALFVLTSNLTAMLGPPLVGVCTDYLFGRPAAIGAALSLVCGVAAAIAAVVLAWGARHYRASLAGLAAERGADAASLVPVRMIAR
ncbi:MAG: MFS transporter [Gammaproteobacteria bacterium]|nr:MFS transporter [Gammaproteobacteria bacterium]